VAIDHIGSVLSGLKCVVAFCSRVTSHVDACAPIHLFPSPVPAVEIMKEGATVTLRNAKIDMFKGSMRLAVDKWGIVTAAEAASFEPKVDNNLSLVEYELVNVIDE
jgi:hypothetical protein